jgi:hypothetical protein
LVGISKADAADLYQAADYIESTGFENLLAMPEPDKVGYVAYQAEAIGTDTRTSIKYGYTGSKIGTVTPEILIRHANGGTFGTILDLQPLTVRPVVIFFPALPVN